MGDGEAMHALATRLWPIARSLTGPGFRESLAIIAETAGPMEIHRWPTGEQVLDWQVPDEWTIREAWIRGPGGERVVDFAEHNLHVLGYSEPVHLTLPLEELQGHLHSIPEQPTAIPYITSYYRRRWGFCLSHDARERLVDGDYEVHIDADLGPGHVEVGEVVVEGGEQEVLFSTYCCHPSMANNELSGPVIAAHLAAAVRSRPERRYTYRFLFLPETIGSICYLARFGDRLREHLAAGYVITCAGDRGALTYKRSRRGDSLADRVAEHVLRGSEHQVIDFFPLGSDERQFCSPGFNLPVGSLMRTRYGTYAEYHTSLDDLSFITPEALGDTLEKYVAIVGALEANDTLASAEPYGEPQLGKRGLYPTLGGPRAVEQAVSDMMWLLNLCDGTQDLVAVAERAGRPLAELAPIAERLIEAGLLLRA